MTRRGRKIRVIEVIGHVRGVENLGGLRRRRWESIYSMERRRWWRRRVVKGGEGGAWLWVSWPWCFIVIIVPPVVVVGVRVMAMAVGKFHGRSCSCCFHKDGLLCYDVYVVLMKSCPTTSTKRPQMFCDERCESSIPINVNILLGKIIY